MSATEFLAQRLSAAIMAPLVLLHIIMIILAVQGGLTGEEILSRTRGNLLFAALYATFVLAAATHAAIGLANILSEWSPLSRHAARLLGHTFGAVMCVLGLRAVWAVL